MDPPYFCYMVIPRLISQPHFLASFCFRLMTRSIWGKLVPRLVEHYTVVVTDLRGGRRTKNKEETDVKAYGG